VFTALSNKLEGSFRNLGLGLLLAVFSLPLWAQEEASVKADAETSQKQSQQAFFESQMKTYSQTVSEEYKGLVQIRLESSILKGQSSILNGQQSIVNVRRIVALYGPTRW
jgi:uncharacterized protein (DUF4415 family)